MTHGFQRFTKRYVNVLGVLIGLTVVSSFLFYSGCGMTSSPTIRTNPTPTPDTVRPTSIITSPTTGGIVSTGATVNITGTASDTGGDGAIGPSVGGRRRYLESGYWDERLELCLVAYSARSHNDQKPGARYIGKSAGSSGGGYCHSPGCDAANFDNHVPNSRSDCINRNQNQHHWNCE